MTTNVTPVLGLHGKLAQVMYEVERIPKNGTAPQAMGGFRFVEAGDAADVIRKALAEHKVTMIPTAIDLIDSTEHQTSGGKSMTTVTVRTTWTLTDGDSGETAVIQSMGSGADTGDKAIPKAQTNAMKYALLMGFLLSTGDDPERVDTSDRQTRPPAPPNRPELERPVDGLIGTVEVGKVPVDMELRQTPTGPAYGFKLKNGTKGYQALATGKLAESLRNAGLTVGEQVQVWGKVEMVPWDKDGKPMPPFARIAIERVQTREWTLPALSVVPSGSGDISEDEAAEILAREMAEAQAEDARAERLADAKDRAGYPG